MTTASATAYRVVIGLETHVQLRTQSKMFCGCAADYANARPNTHVCPVCLGMPGVLPVINREAVNHTIRTGLALNCEIPDYAKFDRKNYAYPDLMKWYQISQYDLPLCINGHFDVDVDGATTRVGITRVHLEEDTARLTHVTAADGSPASLIDVNRSGAPLMEIVSEPDIQTPAEAMAYGEKLRALLRWIGVSTANMEDGALRIDANISVWPQGEPIGDVKVEVKNMNSFRALGRALAFEIERQTGRRERGEAIEQETRGWDETSGATRSQRTKEYAHDYRYFPEPDLPPLHITRERVDALRAALPRMPDQVAADLIQQGAPEADVAELVQDRPLTDYSLAVIGAGASAGEAVTWIVHEFRRALNAQPNKGAAIPISPAEIASLLTLRANGSVSSTMAGEVLDEMFATGKSAEEIVQARGPQISGQDELLSIARQVIQENPQAVQDYRDGKGRALQFLMGQVMRITRGKANPRAVSTLIRTQLDAES
ncbi:MAG: Asp-tRNA(Asn)/Glu-tRNA(Gln) amidotransferase subunit GatB [Chloroflexota bacterium]|nr:Asp-tRNA(Asn)/Glu-tRNA(Gln) amidotransferase subunit GatB [Chloroflexota bacterium]MDE2919838.1 Asp-tRNA(Asn)/Glu-tRNA(Gln) amidotransferase subunit GatB [Chloroflexota bacterium]